MSFDKIAVVDFGGQYAHLIATKVRRLNVLSEILDPQAPIAEFRKYRGIILSGSPDYSSAGEGSNYTAEIFDLDLPILGFCFGHQEIAKRYGGAVERTGREFGLARLHVMGLSPIFAGLDEVETVWMSHGDTVTALPEGFIELGYSTTGTAAGADESHGDGHRNAAIACDEKRRYGFQFHPEVDDTVHGQRMLANFVVDICGCTPSWTASAFARQIQDEIRAEVGDRNVLLLVSGGVDSTVAARLLALALGPERLRLVHIDNGLMRLGESAQVGAELEALGLGASLHSVDASSTFLAALEGVVEPEKKREIIGNTFIEVSDQQARALDLDNFVLGQGTIYPDHIETGGTTRADVIKTHHNRVPIVEQMIAQGRVVEPLSELYKVEVRELGRELGIQPSALDRHPFPGPGLGIRVLCSSGEEATSPGEKEKLEAAGMELDRVLISTAFRGRVLEIRSVGVKADLRSYEHPVLLQPLPAADGLPSHEELLALAARIYKQVPGINRCLLQLCEAGQRGGDIGWPPLRLRPATLTVERLDLLRQLDAQVMFLLDKYGLMKTIWQCPTVLLPMSSGHGDETQGEELVVLRPVLSERGMTARPAALPAALIAELLEFTRGHGQVTAVTLDISTKPPGTIEWE